MRRAVLGLAVALVSVPALTGCGGSQISHYCAALKKDQTAIANMLSGSSATALLDNQSMLAGLAAKSPDDLTDEWQTFLGALSELSSALKAAHVTPGQFRGGKPPPGLSAGQRQAIAAAADDLASPAVLSAASGIDQEAKDVCQLDLSL